MKRLHVIIFGKVQGVNFRWATYEKALQLNLTGWVKNIPNRKVEAVFEGGEEHLKQMLQFIRNGPLAAKVREVEEDWSQIENPHPEFTITY